MPTLLQDWLAPLAASGPGWLVLAFVLGLVHALDADHVMALSVFATRGREAGAGIRAGLRWSLGHGLVLLVVGLALVAFGRALPASIAALADRAVGLVMIGLGLYVFRELARHRAHLHFHAHDGLPPHSHWHGHAPAETRPPIHQHEHGALFVGALHGLAGSAPILALLPVAQHSPRLAIAQLLLFGLGVAAAMVVVSGLLGHVAFRLGRVAGSEERAVTGVAGQAAGTEGVVGRDGQRGLAWLRGVGAAGSVAIGAWLTFGA